jgi:hypothetical protein
MSRFVQVGILFLDPMQIIGFQVRWEGDSLGVRPEHQFAVIVFAGAHALVCSNHQTVELALSYMHAYMRHLPPPPAPSLQQF